jgi:hypothetical protein
MQAISEAFAIKYPADDQFGLRVLAANRRHHNGALFGRDNIGHGSLYHRPMLPVIRLLCIRGLSSARDLAAAHGVVLIVGASLQSGHGGTCKFRIKDAHFTQGCRFKSGSIKA